MEEYKGVSKTCPRGQPLAASFGTDTSAGLILSLRTSKELRATGTMTTMRFELGDGLSMPGVGLGTFQMSGSACESAVKLALGAGYKHIDTAEGYRNEAEVGKGIHASGVDRASVYVTTKSWPGNPAWGMPAKTYEQTIEACKQSASHLGSIDLYLIHAPMAGSKEARIEQWKALVECRRLGLCKSIGVCNYGVSHLEEIAEAKLPMPAANQLELHPMNQYAELLAYMAKHKILPIAYSSLALLSSWREGYTESKGTKSEEETRTGEQAVAAVAGRLGVSPARVLLRYALQKGWPCLPKSTQEARIRENIDLDSFELGVEDMKALDALERGTAFAWDAAPGQHLDLTALQ